MSNSMLIEMDAGSYHSQLQQHGARFAATGKRGKNKNMQRMDHCMFSDFREAASFAQHSLLIVMLFQWHIRILHGLEEEALKQNRANDR